MADQALATSKNCMVCHAVDKKLVGPPYKDVAANYAGQKDAVDKLAVKIIKGGSGVWGPVPMPANHKERSRSQKLAAWVMARSNQRIALLGGRKLAKQKAANLWVGGFLLLQG